jgi:2-C-methyl-D-erythritol 2,4-cyclodiphosphate synthase
MVNIRVGYGYDVHQLSEGRSLWLGGVQVPYEKGLLGHSDADVLLHAICDALLGAAGLRDIGFQFPDTDQNYKGIDSKILLKSTQELIASKGYAVGNLDCTLIAEAPKIKPYIEAMQGVISEILSISEDQIAIKATTSERMGFVGRMEGMAAHCVTLLYKADTK